jgi:hypothetical protein
MQALKVEIIGQQCKGEKYDEKTFY